jgi:hypothetical protein
MGEPQAFSSAYLDVLRGWQWQSAFGGLLSVRDCWSVGGSGQVSAFSQMADVQTEKQPQIALMTRMNG